VNGMCVLSCASYTPTNHHQRMSYWTLWYTHTCLIMHPHIHKAYNIQHNTMFLINIRELEKYLQLTCLAPTFMVVKYICMPPGGMLVCLPVDIMVQTHACA